MSKIPDISQLFKDANSILLRVKGSVLPSLIVPVTLLSLYSFLFVLFHRSGILFSMTNALVPILSVVTGLLVSFRTSSAYDRWWEGRRCWSTLTGLLRNYARITWMHVKEGENMEQRLQKEESMNLLSAYTMAVKHHLREEKGVMHRDLKRLLPRNYVITHLRQDNIPLNLPLEITFLLNGYADLFVEQKRMESSHLGSLNGILNNITDCLCSLERISTTPIPLAYQIHLKQLLTLYCLSLAPQLVDTLGFQAVMVTAIAAFAFFGVEYIGLEIENPFGYDFNDLPVEKFCLEISKEIEILQKTSFNPLEWTKVSTEALPPSPAVSPIRKDRTKTKNR